MGRLQQDQGHQGHQGHSDQGHLPDSGPLADAFGAVRGNSLVPGGSAALGYSLVTTREALVPEVDNVARVPLKQAFANADSDGLPKVDGFRRFDDASLDIRQINMLGELLQPLHLEADRDARSVTLSHIKLYKSKKTFTDLPIFKVTRPPKTAFGGAQLALVQQWAELRNERLGEITQQLAIPWQYWNPVVDLNPDSYPATLEMLSLAIFMGYHVLQPVKHYLGCPRPAHYSPSIQPVIRPRRFAAFPSGHAMEAFLVARLLSHLAGYSGRANDPVGPLDTQLQRLARRIADNRVVAGVHFHIDSVAGRMLAECLAGYFLARCAPANRGWLPLHFDGSQLAPRTGDPKAVKEALSRPLDCGEPMHGQHVKSPYFTTNKNAQKVEPSIPPSIVTRKRGQTNCSLLQHTWAAAEKEWKS